MTGLAAAMLLVAAGPEAPLPCYDYREIARQLGAAYEEAPVSLGRQANGNVLQVFASGRTGTWTILSLSPDGTACIVAVGDAWEPLRPEPVEPAA
jgi:hypothetical protein